MARTTDSPKRKPGRPRKNAVAASTAPATAASRRSHPAWRTNWVGGTTLVVLGLLFLVQEYTSFDLNNWWALFLLIPTVYAWSAAYRFYKIDNVVGRRAWGTFIAGLYPALVAIIFLNNLDWGKIWPLFLIIAGLGALAPRPKPANS